MTPCCVHSYRITAVAARGSISVNVFSFGLFMLLQTAERVSLKQHVLHSEDQEWPAQRPGASAQHDERSCA